jgi:hypothetical protein
MRQLTDHALLERVSLPIQPRSALWQRITASIVSQGSDRYLVLLVATDLEVAHVRLRTSCRF